MVIIIGTAGFKVFSGNNASILDALYMTAITITTVGYGDIVGVEKTAGGKIFTIIYIFIGAGAIAYL
ncbi:MAG: potassium channel family protein, partial [Syntrophorhabdus sp.]